MPSAATSDQPPAQNLWSSRLGFLLAGVGAAVGIGNIWRFSAVLGENGGGAYLIPYLVSIALFAVPLMVLELAIGRHYRASLVGALASVHRRLPLGGWLVYTVVFAILSYYLVITGWTLAFLVFAVFDIDETFAGFTNGLWPYLFFCVSAGLTGATVSFGVRGGIERLTRYVMPLAFVLVVVLAIRSFTLDGIDDALDFMFAPDFGVWSERSLWGAAIGQAFFSLSVGFGVLLAYGSYLDDRTDLVRSAGIIALADVLVAVLAGLIVFPIVFSFGLAPSLGAELAFTTLPLGFDAMGGGRIVAIGFFLLIFLAALTSAVSMLEANVAAVTERTGRSRRQVSLILTIALVGLGTPAALSYTSVGLELFDARVLDFMDDTLGTLGLPVTALFIALAFVWWGPPDLLARQLPALGALPRRVLRTLLRWVIPAVLCFVTAARLADSTGFQGMRWLPGADSLSVLTRDAGALGTAAALLVATLIVIRVLRAR